MQQEPQPTSAGIPAPLWAVVGLAVGALAVFFAFRGSSEPALPPGPKVSQMPATVPAPDEPEPAQPATEETPAVEATTPAEPGTAAAGTEAPGAPPSDPPAAPPLRPPTELRGSVPDGIGGTNPFQPGPAVAIRSPEVQLVRLNVYTSGPESARAEVEGYARSIGGKTRAFVDFGNSENRESEGLLVLVPEKQVEATVKFVQSRNSNVAEQAWRVSPQVRQARLEDETQAALFELKAKRQQLLVKYLDDADPVKQVEEAIVEAERALKRLRLEESEQELAAIKITFGPRG